MFESMPKTRADVFAELLKEPISEAYARELLATNERLAEQIRKLREAAEYALSKFGDEYEGRLGPLRDALKETEPSDGG